MTKKEREELLKIKLIEKRAYENHLRSEGFNVVCGIDEVGRGPLAGPVVTAAVVLPDDFNVLGIDDSKKLSERKREELFEKITEKALAYGVGMCDNNVIDEINILEATKSAMYEAIKNLRTNLKEKGLDDVDCILVDAVKLEIPGIHVEGLIKGDANHLVIAAASIVAKVIRDKIMVEYSEIYPNYAFESNKGYGTKAHYEGLREYGITPIHRKSFLKNFAAHK